MPDPITSSTPSFSSNDAFQLLNVIGALVAVVAPGEAAAVAALSGAASSIRTILMPTIQHFQAQQLSVAEQAALAAESAAERARVGAPPATIN